MGALPFTSRSHGNGNMMSDGLKKKQKIPKYTFSVPGQLVPRLVVLKTNPKYTFGQNKFRPSWYVSTLFNVFGPDLETF